MLSKACSASSSIPCFSLASDSMLLASLLSAPQARRRLLLACLPSWPSACSSTA
jgi:hypothetical protein